MYIGLSCRGHFHGDRAFGLREWVEYHGVFPPSCGSSHEPGGIKRLGQVADTQIGSRMTARSPFIIAAKLAPLGNVWVHQRRDDLLR